MKTISPTLKSALATGNRCYLLKVTGNDGVDYGFTNHDKELSVDGVTYYPAPGLKHLNTYYTNSAEVSSTKFEMAYVDVVDEELIRSGVFDNAEYVIYRVAWDNLAAGKYEHDSGRLASVKWTENKMFHETHGYERNLAEHVGYVSSPSCRHTFCDQFGDRDKPGACTLNPATYTSTSSVSSVNTQLLKITIASTGKTDGYFSLGVLTWTSGNNNGLSVPIKIHSVGGTETIEFARTTFASIQVGDTFSVLAGCDKSFDTCRDKYSNTVNFGGEPYMKPGVSAGL